MIIYIKHTSQLGPENWIGRKGTTIVKISFFRKQFKKSSLSLKNILSLTTEHLSIPVAEDEGDDGSLEGVEEDVCVLVNCQQIAAA